MFIYKEKTIIPRTVTAIDNSPRFVGRSPRKKTARIVTQIIPVDSIMGVTFNSTPRYANTLITVVPNRSPYPRITLQFRNLNKIFLCTIIAIILFFVNKRNIEINSMKELFISIIALFIITFMAIYILKESIFINKSSAVIWLIYPYYLLYRYVYLIKEQFLKRILR